MSKRRISIAARLFFSLLTLAAIATQFVVHLQHRFDLLNFFSYFTNLSNIFAAAVLLFGAATLLRRRAPTATDDLIRGAAVVAMAIVGIVFSILLRDTDLGTLLPWVNTVVHYIMPVVMVADWCYQPPQSQLGFAQAGYWLIYPFLYLAYSLIRGAISGFYPYPFLNPAQSSGYGGVSLYCLAIFAAFLVASWLLILVGDTLQRIAPSQAA